MPGDPAFGSTTHLAESLFKILMLEAGDIVAMRTQLDRSDH
jgi:hypothetical protein